jgi:hypothetical protein
VVTPLALFLGVNRPVIQNREQVLALEIWVVDEDVIDTDTSPELT